MEENERQLIAYWNNKNGDGEKVLWLERASDGTLFLCDYGDCVVISEGELDEEVASWDEATSDVTGQLRMVTVAY